MRGEWGGESVGEDAWEICWELIPAGGVFAFLAEHREVLFPAAMFADMYSSLATAVVQCVGGRLVRFVEHGGVGVQGLNELPAARPAEGVTRGDRAPASPSASTTAPTRNVTIAIATTMSHVCGPTPDHLLRLTRAAGRLHRAHRREFYRTDTNDRSGTSRHRRSTIWNTT
jgi:hypothetical protein